MLNALGPPSGIARLAITLSVLLTGLGLVSACSETSGGAEAKPAAPSTPLTDTGPPVPATDSGQAVETMPPPDTAGAGENPPPTSPSAPAATPPFEAEEALKLRDSLIVCLLAAGYPSAPLETEGARLIMPLTTSNVGLISITSRAEPVEDVLAVYQGDVPVIYQEPGGTYVEGWTLGQPEAEVLAALDGCYMQTGLPANERGRRG